MKIYSKNQFAKISSWLVIIIMPFINFFLCQDYSSGPAYLADEIGYLAKASFIAGYTIDGSSSYYPGYSLILAPLFAFFSNTNQIWQGVLLINAVLWGLSLFTLSNLLRIFAPQSTSMERFFALLFTSLYPSFFTMAGYAFPSNFQVFIFTCSLFTLSKWKSNKTPSVLPFSFCVGFYFWIHPTGLALILSSIIVIALVSFHRRSFWPLALHIIVVFCLSLSCNLFLNWINISMTPENWSLQTHYPSIVTIVEYLRYSGFWTKFIGLCVGQLSYLLIGSFGLIATLLPAVLHSRSTIFSAKTQDLSQNYQVVLVFNILSILFTIGIGSLIFTSPRNVNLLSYWLYGRYSDCQIPFLLAFGFISLCHYSYKLRLKYSAICAIVVLIAGLFIDLSSRYNVIHIENTSNLINIPSFWPQYLIPYSTFLLWMMIGIFGILAAAIFGKYAAIILMIFSFFVSYPSQVKWHRDILNNYSKPSSLIELIHANYSPGSCVGVDYQSTINMSSYTQERFSLYSFYLFNYNFRRMTFYEWRNGCNGPFLSYNGLQFIEDDQSQVTAREKSTGLLFITREVGNPIKIPNTITNISDIYITQEIGEKCLVFGCFKMTASELTSASLVGALTNNTLVTTNHAGFLFYGPYYPLKKGQYYLILNGKFDTIPDANLDIVSDSGSIVHYKTYLSWHKPEDGQPVILPFEIRSDVQDLQIRLAVSEYDEISISSYEVVLAEESDIQLSKCEIFGCFEMTASELTSASLVGALTNNTLVTTNHAGFLFYGPYYPLKKGQYYLILNGKFDTIPDANLDIVSDSGSMVHYKTYLSRHKPEDGQPVILPFEIRSDVQDLQIRLAVSRSDNLVINSYEIVLAEESDIQLSKCEIFGCFEMTASELTSASLVGALTNNTLVTTNHAGFLFYGPYYPLKKGQYYLILNGKFDTIPDANLDIVSDFGSMVHYKTYLSWHKPEDGQPVILPFEIRSDVQDLQIRLAVSEYDEISISSYEVVLAEESDIQLSIPLYIIQSKDKIFRTDLNSTTLSLPY